jgi:hypothetical protein
LLSGKVDKEAKMKKIILLLVLIALPLMAEEIWLGMVMGIEGDSLVLTDNLKIYSPAQFRQYTIGDEELLDLDEITFPFKASLIKDDKSAEFKLVPKTTIKIHNFYDVIDGRPVKRTSY